MGKLNTACENIHAYIIDCSHDNIYSGYWESNYHDYAVRNI